MTAEKYQPTSEELKAAMEMMTEEESEMTASREKELGKEYKNVVEEIKELNWENLNGTELQQLMFLSHVSAREFGEALRIALKLYPDNKNLQEMAEGELQATNLKFEDYDQAGDHADFLDHFLKKNGLHGDETLALHAEAYRKACSAMEDKVRAMTIFSREEELAGIFQRILQARDWTAAGLPAFRYYLEQHIALDSQEGGHADLTREFPVNDDVKPFYESRKAMYRAIPALFEKE